MKPSYMRIKVTDKLLQFTLTLSEFLARRISNMLRRNPLICTRTSFDAQYFQAIRYSIHSLVAVRSSLRLRKSPVEPSVLNSTQHRIPLD